jgi:hypothetical protein
MGRIYTCASRVLAWLGPGEQDHFPEALQKLSTQAERIANFLDHFYDGTIDTIGRGDSIQPAPFWKF